MAFRLDKVSRSEFSGFSEIKKFVKASLEQATLQGLESRVKIYEQLLNEISTTRNISVLSIHDWNTKGLLDQTEPWSVIGMPLQKGRSDPERW